MWESIIDEIVMLVVLALIDCDIAIETLRKIYPCRHNEEHQIALISLLPTTNEILFLVYNYTDKKRPIIFEDQFW